MGATCCPKTSVSNYQPTLHNILEEWRHQLHYSRSLQSCKGQHCYQHINTQEQNKFHPLSLASKVTMKIFVWTHPPQAAPPGFINSFAKDLTGLCCCYLFYVTVDVNYCIPPPATICSRNPPMKSSLAPVLSVRSQWLTQISVSSTSMLMSPNNHAQILMQYVLALFWKLECD